MQRSRLWLTLSLFFAALLVLILFWTALSGTFLGLLYRNAPGFSTAHSVTQIASILTAIVLFITGVLIALPVAFQPGSLLQKVLYVIPLFLLILTFVGVISNIVGIGTTGTLIDIGGGTMLNFSAAWVVVGLILSAIAVVIAAVRTELPLNTLKNAVRLASLTSGLGVIAAAGLVATALIVSTSQPTFGFPGGGPQQGPGNQQAPAQGTQQAQGTEQAGRVSQGARGTAQPGVQGTRPQAPAGPGGPGGGPGALTRTFSIGGIAGGVAGIVLLVCIIGSLRSLSSLPAESPATVVQPDYQRGLGSVLVSFVIVGVVVLAVIQLVPVSRDNPPVTSNIQWDSPQTQQLVERACANCHSNETTWPWYAYIAPSSWLTTMHVHSARERYNLSEMSNTELARFAQNAPDAIRMKSMPPADYLFMHPEAQLTDAEKQQLIVGLQKTFPRQGGVGYNLNGF